MKIWTVSDEIAGIDNNTKTFEDLKTEIDNTEDGGTLNLTQDYVYESGSTEGILINKSITINGNNHKIDGGEKSRIFKAQALNVTINDISLVNGYSKEGGAIYCDSPILLNNVVFENNRADDGGAIFYVLDFSLDDSITINNCIFDGNYAARGAVLFVDPKSTKIVPDGNESDCGPVDDYPEDNESDYTYDDYPEGNGSDYTYDDIGPDGNETDDDSDSNESGSDDQISYPDNIVIVNSIFKNSYDCPRGMICFNTAGYISIINSTFANSTSDYGTAVMGIVSITLKSFNNTFMNLHAISGGALTLRLSDTLIENCRFINVTSSSNGGAICSNGNAEDGMTSNSKLIIRNSEFINGQSKYGGCIAYFGSALKIYDSIFENSTAIASGGQFTLSTVN